MKHSKLFNLIIGVSAMLYVGCATTVETTMKKSWEREIAFDEEIDLTHAQMHFSDNNEAVTLISPSGIEALDSKGSSVYEVNRENFFASFLESAEGVEVSTDKISYIYLPHRHALLEFNYSMTAESVTMIDLETRNIQWVKNDLKWSLERYQTLVKAASKGLSLGKQASANAASQVLLPKRFVRDMTYVIPELDAFLFKTLDGLKLISFENGQELWSNDDIKGGIAKMIFDEKSNSIVVVNSDDEAFSIPGLQFNKQIARIDVESGSTIWSNSYDGKIREKLNGIGEWGDRETDIRLLDDAVMLNFLNVELYDFESGEQLWQTTEGANKLIDMAAPEAQIMNLFAFPVIHDGILYRVGFENVGLTGVDVIIEAFDKKSGERLWKSGKLSRSKPVNSMLVANNRLIVSMSSSEGVVAMDAKTGDRIWDYGQFGRSGVKHHLQLTDHGVLVPGNDKIIMLNPSTGEEIYSINTGNQNLGGINDLRVSETGIAVSGDKGFAMYNVEDGSNLQSIATPTGGMILPGKDRFLIAPHSNSGAFYVIDSNGQLKGTLGTDSKRRSWTINEDYNEMYVLSENKLIMYVTE